MTHPLSNQNLNAHYSSSVKVQRPKKTVAEAPPFVPNKMPYYDNEATVRMQNINNSIYKDYQAEKKKEAFGVIKFVFTTAIVILGFLGLKHIFKKC
jgi:hypothetical protein